MSLAVIVVLLRSGGLCKPNPEPVPRWPPLWISSPPPPDSRRSLRRAAYPQLPEAARTPTPRCGTRPAEIVGLKDLIEHQLIKAERALGREVRVLCCYEAGYAGFWLARWLDRTMSVETVVLDPANLLVNRKAKQRKTDRIDARKMVRALLAHDRGDAAVLSRVRIQSVEEEDRKRLLRERRRLVKERTSLTNAVKGLLKLHGVFDLQPRAKGFEARFAEVRTAYGSTFPPRARQEILRLAERLSLVERQIAQVEAERDAIVRQGEALAVPVAPGGSDAQAAARMATLTRLKGIDENDATLLTHEIFYRGFRNRRELASWVGITAPPWTSGDTQRDQGISRDGPAWIRAQLVQMAWRWLRHQLDSALSKWFEDRTAGGRGRIRRVMVVALARRSSQSSASSYPQAIANMRKRSMAGSVWTTRSGSRHSRKQSASASASPSQRSAARSGTSPPSDEIDPPAKSAITFLR